PSSNYRVIRRHKLGSNLGPIGGRLESGPPANVRQAHPPAASHSPLSTVGLLRGTREARRQDEDRIPGNRDDFLNVIVDPFPQCVLRSSALNLTPDGPDAVQVEQPSATRDVVNVRTDDDLRLDAETLDHLDA